MPRAPPPPVLPGTSQRGARPQGPRSRSRLEQSTSRFRGHASAARATPPARLQGGARGEVGKRALHLPAVPVRPHEGKGGGRPPPPRKPHHRPPRFHHPFRTNNV